MQAKFSLPSHRMLKLPAHYIGIRRSLTVVWRKFVNTCTLYLLKYKLASWRTDMLIFIWVYESRFNINFMRMNKKRIRKHKNEFHQHLISTPSVFVKKLLLLAPISFSKFRWHKQFGLSRLLYLIACSVAVVWLVNLQSAGIVFLSPLSELRFYRGSLQLSIPDKHEEKTLSLALNKYTKSVANPFSAKKYLKYKLRFAVPTERKYPGDEAVPTW